MHSKKSINILFFLLNKRKGNIYVFQIKKEGEGKVMFKTKKKKGDKKQNKILPLASFSLLS